ncbi:hypothetical protein Gotri_019593 [Gossypium trilobum]|uniref:NB-ARC domain-containing protein n=1 Tax=Gossypium trilobum TaxID=34281 RepID=A0A7J9EDF0_9ROSI|nr:hypothetical protein [Gossypium trilobum]
MDFVLNKIDKQWDNNRSLDQQMNDLKREVTGLNGLKEDTYSRMSYRAAAKKETQEGNDVSKRIKEIEELIHQGKFQEGLVVYNTQWIGQVISATRLSGKGTKACVEERWMMREFVGQAGTVFEVGKSILGLIENNWEFPKGIDENANNLKRKGDRLNGQKEGIESRIKSRLRPRKKISKEVVLYFEDVKRMNGEIPILVSKVSTRSFFSRGFLVNDVRKMGEELDELLEKGRFSDDLLVDDLSWIGQVLPTPSFVVDAIELVKNKIIRYLRNDGVQKIGVYGMAGVGKTTVVKLVNNELLKSVSNFDIIVWVTVSREFSVIELQKKIAEAMNVVITGFSLEKVGIPEFSGGKLVLTAQSMDVCRQMDCHVIKMERLPEQDAWQLFLDNVGHNLMNFTDLLPIARCIVERCAGLPLVIVTVACTMRGERSLPIWRNALVELKSNILVWVKNEVYSQLRFSYDRLKDSGIQKCFLTCASYCEDLGILKGRLIMDWIEKGLIDEMGSKEVMLDKGQAILRTLVENCLLEDVGNERVRMHDLTIDMAKLIIQEL